MAVRGVSGCVWVCLGVRGVWVCVWVSECLSVMLGVRGVCVCVCVCVCLREKSLKSKREIAQEVVSIGVA